MNFLPSRNHLNLFLLPKQGHLPYLLPSLQIIPCPLPVDLLVKGSIGQKTTCLLQEPMGQKTGLSETFCQSYTTNDYSTIKRACVICG